MWKNCFYSSHHIKEKPPWKNFTLAYLWLRLQLNKNIRKQDKKNQEIKSNVVLQCNGFFFTKTEGHFEIFKKWLFWLHWNETFIPQMLSSVGINYSYQSCFQLQVISYKKQKIRDILLTLRNHKFLKYCFFIKLE